MSTIALNMIVGPGEASELERCLETFGVKKRFDEIVICRTSLDPMVEKITAKFATNHFYRPWSSERYPHGSFAEARNAALDTTKSDYVMWLDADDILLPQFNERFDRFIDIVKNDANSVTEVYFVPYAVINDMNGNPETTFLRDRVFKRTKAFRWWSPVHEQITRDWTNKKYATIKGMHISHAAKKPFYCSAERNVRILLHEEKVSERVHANIGFFLARDLLLLGRIDEAIPRIEKMIDTMCDNDENLYLVCVDVMYSKAYGGIDSHPHPSKINENNADAVELWARRALGFVQHCAEPYVLLGDVYALRKDNVSARRMYETALSKEFGTGTMQTVTYYEEMPAWRLSMMDETNAQYESALWYNKKALAHNPRNDDYLQQRKRILEKIIEETGGIGKQRIELSGD